MLSTARILLRIARVGTDTAVEQVSRPAVGRVALRVHMVLLAGRGYRMPQIAAIHP